MEDSINHNPSGNYQPIHDYSNVKFNKYVTKQLSMKEEDFREMETDQPKRVGDKTQGLPEYTVRSYRKHDGMTPCYLLLDSIVLVLGLGLTGGMQLVIGAYAYMYLLLWAFLGGAKLFFVCVVSQIPTLIQNIRTDSNAAQIIEGMRKHKPHPRYGIECYHLTKYKKRVRKVVTFRKYKEFKFKHWADWSPEIAGALEDSPISAIMTQKRLIFYDKATNSKYYKLREKVEKKHKARDTEYKMTDNVHLKEFHDNILALHSADALPWWCNSLVFCVSCFFCAGGYNYLFWNNVARVNYIMIKVVSRYEAIKTGGQEGLDVDHESDDRDESIRDLGSDHYDEEGKSIDDVEKDDKQKELVLEDNV